MRLTPKAKRADNNRKHVVDVCPRNGSLGTSSLYSRSFPTIHVNCRILQARHAKETSMQYKTITLELLRERTELYEQLRLSHRLLPTLETCARELKDRHESWKATLATAKPDS